MAIFPALLALLLIGSPPRPAFHLERCHATSVETSQPPLAAPVPATP